MKTTVQLHSFPNLGKVVIRLALLGGFLVAFGYIFLMLCASCINVLK